MHAAHALSGASKSQTPRHRSVDTWNPFPMMDSQVNLRKMHPYTPYLAPSVSHCDPATPASVTSPALCCSLPIAARSVLARHQRTPRYNLWPSPAPQRATTRCHRPLPPTTAHCHPLSSTVDSPPSEPEPIPPARISPGNDCRASPDRQRTRGHHHPG